MKVSKKQLPKDLPFKILNKLEQTVILLDGKNEVVYTNHDVPEDILEGSAVAVKEKADKIYNGTKQLVVDDVTEFGCYTAIIGTITTDYSKQLNKIKQQDLEVKQRLTTLLQSLAV